MWIKTVRAKSFKRFIEAKAFEFKVNANALYGTNNAGKTTIAEIVCVTLYGCNLYGSNQGLENMHPESLVTQFLRLPEGLDDQFEEWSKENKGSYVARLTKFRKQLGLTQEEQPSFETYVEFENNDGVTWNVLRTRKYGGSTTIKLNGAPVSQTELNNYLPPKELFYAVFVPGFFLKMIGDTDSDRKKEQRSLLMSYLPQVDWKEYLGDMKEHALIKNSRDLGIVASVVKAEFKRLNLEVITLEQRKLVLEQQLQLSGEGAIDSHLDGLKVEYENNKKLASELDVLDNEFLRVWAINEDRSQRNTETDKDLSRTEKRVLEINNNLEQMQNLEEPHDLASQLVMELESVKVPQLTLPPRPVADAVNLDMLPVASSLKDCPSCGADLEAYASEKIAEVDAANKKRLKKAADATAKSVAAWDAECKTLTEKHGKDNEAVLKKRAELSTSIVKAREKQASMMRDYTQLVTARATMQGELETLKGKEFQKMELLALPAASVGEEPNIRLVKEAMAGRQNKLSVLFERYNAAMVAAGAEDQRRAMAASLQNELVAIPGQLAQAQEWLATALKLKSKLAEVPSMMLDAQLAGVRQYVPHVGMSFYKEIKSTGKLEPDLQFYYKGAALKVLSNSWTISLGLDLSSMLNMLSGQNIPVFVDNAESIVELPDSVVKQQYFAAYVSKDHQEMVVSGR